MCERPLIFVATLSLIACRSTRPLQPPLSLAVFTPDGLGLVFSAARDEKCFLYRAEISTGVARRLTGSESSCEFDPAFSADGKWLAFMRAPKDGLRAALFLADSDGRNERVLVPDDQDNLGPVFVPHSNQILFLRSAAFEHHSPLVDNNRHKFDLSAVDLTNGQVSGLTHKQLYDINKVSISTNSGEILLSVSTYPEGYHFLVAPTKNPATFTDSIQPTVPDSPSPPICMGAAWLPGDGRILFMAASLQPGRSDFDYNIYRLVIGTKSIQRLTQLTGLVEGFSVSADGTKAVFLQHGSYSVLNLDTRQLTPVRLRMQ
jgi:Tol biopolymer transport system component